MSEKSPSKPYKSLGTKLKALREHLHESLAEVSGAVEIDEAVLAQIEQGESRPSEDILELLISHFNIEGEEEKKLWKLAGFDQNKQNPHPEQGAVVMMIPFQLPIMYTDMIQATANDSGVVLSFMQNAGQDQPQTVSRVGMSKDQANSLINLLQHVINNSNQPPKALPEGIKES